MNLWIFNHYAHPPDLPGGTRHFDLGRELVKRGHKVTIFASSFHHYLHKEVRLKPGEQWKLEDIEGLRFVWIRTPPYQRNDNRRVQSMLVYALRAWRLGQKLGPVLGRPDVVIGSSPHPFASLAAYWVARHHQTPFVMEVRDLLAPDPYRYGGTWCPAPPYEGAPGLGEVPLPSSGVDHYPGAEDEGIHYRPRHFAG